MTVPTSSGTRTPVAAAQLGERVQDVLEDFLAIQGRVLDALGEELGPLLDAASELLRGGKRLRAAFSYWGWRGAGGSDCAEIVRAAAALELFHDAALIHDDVMDDSDTRRGMPAAHRRFATLHRSNRWAGRPHEYGVASAILLGDLCLCWSDELLATSGVAPDRLSEGRRVFDMMRTQLMGGQYLDMLEQARADTSVERARRVVRFKTAKYTVEHPLLLGGRLAGADRDLLAAYTDYGLPLGEAYQLRDDVLGVFGDPSETGKPAGDDLREGKRTVLVATALERADAAQAAAVRRHLGDPALDGDGLAALRQILVDTGAVRDVEARIDQLTEQAIVACRSAPLAPPADDALCELAVRSTARRG